MPYRVARVAGDPRRLVLHPERGAPTTLLIGLGAASATAVVALASAAFAGWVGTEAYVTRIELSRNEREGRLEIRSRAVGGVKETMIALEELRDVIVERNDAGMLRLVLRMHTDERVALTPYFAGENAVETIASSVRDLLALAPQAALPILRPSSPLTSSARSASKPPMGSSSMKICGTVRRPVVCTSQARAAGSPVTSTSS